MAQTMNCKLRFVQTFIEKDPWPGDLTEWDIIPVIKKQVGKESMPIRAGSLFSPSAL